MRNCNAKGLIYIFIYLSLHLCLYVDEYVVALMVDGCPVGVVVITPN